MTPLLTSLIPTLHLMHAYSRLWRSISPDCLIFWPRDQPLAVGSEWQTRDIASVAQQFLLQCAGSRISIPQPAIKAKHQPPCCCTCEALLVHATHTQQSTTTPSNPWMLKSSPCSHAGKSRKPNESACLHSKELKKCPKFDDVSINADLISKVLHRFTMPSWLLAWHTLSILKANIPQCVFARQVHRLRCSSCQFMDDPCTSHLTLQPRCSHRPDRPWPSLGRRPSS